MNVTINLDENSPYTPWQAAAAVLEGIEPGASKHCLLFEPMTGNDLSVTHYRLNIRITVYA